MRKALSFAVALFVLLTALLVSCNEPAPALKALIPTAEDFIYNGLEQIGVAEGEGYAIEGNKATDAGSYTAIARLEEGYVWEDDTTEDKTFNWSIGKKELAVVVRDAFKEIGDPDPVLLYDCEASLTGEMIREEGEDRGFYDILIGTLQLAGANAGNYTLAIDGTDKFEIKGTDVLIPDAYGKEYDGMEHSFTDDDYSNLEVLSGTEKATNAGNYSVTVKPKTGYCWSDGTQTEKTISWSIAKKELEVVVFNTFKEIGDVDPILTYDEISIIEEIFDCGDNGNVNLTLELTREKGENRGLYDILIDAQLAGANAGNYTLAIDGTDKFGIQGSDVEILNAYNEEYDGHEHAFTDDYFNLEVLSGTEKATNAGNYSVTVKPKQGYCWSDGTQTEKTISWSIAKKELEVVVFNTFKEIGNPDPVLLYDCEASLTGTLSREKGENRGFYDILIGTLQLTSEDAGNYTLVFDGSDKFEIKGTDVMPPTMTIVKYDGLPHFYTTDTNRYWEVVGGIDEAVNVGNYSVDVKPMPGCCWEEDGSQKTIRFRWSIN